MVSETFGMQINYENCQSENVLYTYIDTMHTMKTGIHTGVIIELFSNINIEISRTMRRYISVPNYVPIYTLIL